MAFKIIYGPNGTDKTKKCMELIEQARGRYNQIFYVVPENLSFSAEKEIANRFGAVTEGKVNVTSFKKLYCETVNITGEKKNKKLTGGGIKILMTYLCAKNKNELSLLSKAANSTGFAEVVSRLIQEFKAYNISPDDLYLAADKITDSLKIKLVDLAKLYKAYIEYLESGFSDVQDEMGILEMSIKLNPEIYQNSLFVFDGFQVYTPSEYSVILAIADKSDMVFSFTLDETEFDGFEETYRTQKKCLKKLRELLKNFDETDTIKAEYDERFRTVSENKYILKSILFGENIKAENCPQNIEIHEFADQYQETEFVAEKILELIKKGTRYKDITVIARDSGRYLPVISEVFKDYEIPAFIDKKLSGENQPAINAVVSALEVINNNFSYESVFSYLKTGFSNIDSFEIDLLENYVLATGIRGKSWTNTWKYTPYISKIFDDEEEFLNKINEIRNKTITPILNLKENLLSSKTVKDKTVAIYTFIKEISLFEKIKGMIDRFKEEEPQTAAYYGRVWNLLLDTMDELVSVLGNEVEDTETFINTFMLGISMQDISIVPTNNDVVTVMQPESMSEKAGKIIFVLGVNDGVYPMLGQAEGLLSDNDRIVLENLGFELALNTVEKTFEENYIALKTFLSASEKMYISYPVGDIGGGSRFASTYVKRLTRIFPKLEISSHVVFGGGYDDGRITKPKPTFNKYALNLRQGGKLSENWAKAGLWFKENSEWKDKYRKLENSFNFSPKSTLLEKEVTEKIYEKGINLSVSSLEQYANCPFAYFANYTLRLKPREKTDITVADTGSIMHEALEKLSGVILKNGFAWKNVPCDFLKKELVKIIDDIVIALESKLDYTSARQKLMIARVKKMLEESVMYIAEHLKAGEFEPLGYEIEFGKGKEYDEITFEVAGKKIKLKGKIDRADIYYDEQGRKFVRIIDYKSGDKNFDFSKMLYGLQMQLVVYLDQLCKKTDAEPAGILYFRLFDPVITASADTLDETIYNQLDKEHRMTGLILSDEKIVKAMDKKIDSESKIIPVSLNQDGSLSKKSSVITSTQFKDMQNHIRRLILKIGKEILSGKNDISPVEFSGKTGCDYCEFKKVCLFDEHCGGKFNSLEKLKKNEVLNLIKKAGEEND